MFDPELHWVLGIEPGRLALTSRPRGGEWLEEDLCGWKEAAVVAVVSLLQSHEVRDLELQAEGAICERYGMEFLRHPIADRGVPTSQAALHTFVSGLHGRIHQGQAIAIHCRAGIGRTGLVAGCLLHLLGVPRKDIFHRLSISRGISMPDTEAQAEWVEKFSQRHDPLSGPASPKPVGT